MTDRQTTDMEEQLGALILGDFKNAKDLSAADHLALVARAGDAERASRQLQHQTVAAARGAGVSWAALGRELGMTRQAAQQRFGSRPDQPASGGEERWLGPVTAFDEMAELELAGRQGWRTVGADVLKHRMMRTDTQWEHRRVLWTRPARHYETDGWQLACRAFPWLYLVRDLHRRPESD